MQFKKKNEYVAENNLQKISLVTNHYKMKIRGDLNVAEYSFKFVNKNEVLKDILVSKIEESVQKDASQLKDKLLCGFKG